MFLSRSSRRAEHATRVRLGAFLLLASGGAFAQNHPVQVHVVDSTGLPVANASVFVVGAATNSVSTDQSGIATLPAAPGATLRAHIPGMDSDAIPVSNVPLVLVLHPSGVTEAVTVTATRSATLTGDHAETIDALSQQALRKYPAFVLDDSLRQHAGFELFRRASSRVANPTSEGISLRGLGSTAVSRTLVLLESVPLNDPFGGWIHWDELPPEAVSAVTLATGGGSDLYGSSALGGVIDVLPALPETSRAELSASGAGQDTSDVDGRIDRGTKNWLGTLSGQTFRTAGYIPVNPGSIGAIDRPANVHFQNGHTELDRKIGESGRAFLLGNILNEARGNGTVLTNNATRLWRYVGGDDWSAGSRTTGRFRAFGSEQGYRQSFSSIPASRATEALTRLQRVHTQEIGLSTDAATRVGPFSFVGGADVRDIRANDVETPISAGKVASTLDISARQRFAGAFGEALYGHGPWSAAASLRVDHASNLDTIQRTNGVGAPTPDRAEVVLSPRLGLVRKINGNLSVRAAGFRAFRSPTMNELYRSGQVGQELTLPNNNLLSERATGWETGVNTTSRGGRFSGVATYFWTEINRPVSTVTVSQTASAITLRRQNLGQLRSQGLEVKGELRIVRGLVGTVGYQFADAIVTKNSAQPALIGNRLPEIPEHGLTGQLRYQSSRAGIYTLAMRRSGGVFDDSANTLQLRGFFQADLYGERSFARRFTAFASIQNLTNRRADVAKTPVLSLGTPILAQGGIRVNFGGAR
ncbi:TonB-dependent receptor [Granulicella sibirica]|uniref:TonB-dependent receptor n=1 Tax=Granulicella sibirica TaxID=2479048 RepID=UPI001008A06D|nr:TonB-dependent receptor [Granulicella sibirica]